MIGALSKFEITRWTWWGVQSLFEEMTVEMRAGGNTVQYAYGSFFP